MADDDIEITITPAEREEMGLPPENDAKPKIEVEIEGEEKPPAAAAPAKAAEPEANEEAFATLKRQREEAEAAARAERQARGDAEARAAKAAEVADTATIARINADHQTVLAAIDKVNADAARAEDEYAQALEAGDFRLAAKKQREMAQAETRLDKLGDLKTRVEAAKANPPKPTIRAEGRVERQAPPADPVEAQLQSGQFSTESAAWLRQRPHLLTDRTANARMLAAHYAAVADGHKPDTQDYFAYLEERVDKAPAPGQGTREASSKETIAPRTPLRVAAPPSRQGSTVTQNGNQVKIRLNAAEKAYCDETGESYEEYAANKFALIQEGKLSA